MLLEKIQKENDIKQLKPEELEKLAEEIRQFLVEKISVTGGHLASNLGVVELTMALHLAFELPQDKMIWDVGHQGGRAQRDLHHRRWSHDRRDGI